MTGRLRSNGAVVVAIVVVGQALAASCRSLPPRQPAPQAASPRPLGGPLPAVAAPALRVAILTDVARASVGTSGPVVVWAAGDTSGAGRTLVQRATLAPVAAAGAAVTRFRVQVASLADETAARDAADRAREASRLEPSVRLNPATATYQVRVGEFATRDQARRLADDLGRAGLTGAWVAEELVAPGSGGRLRLVETGDEWPSVVVGPSQAGDLLNVDGAVYRGLIEVRPGEGGSLTVINVVNLEDYLRGVVPNELSPAAFPHIEALKAQAVAARTYALRNRGQFEAKGYDICATPACQVYRGVGSENPVSDRAVAETRGLAAAFGGGWINALYTSTCGGHTEDAANMFEGETAPYLRGVVCAPESAAWATVRTRATPEGLGDEPDLFHDASLLVALGVLEPKPASAKAMKGAASEAEIKGWTRRLATALKRQPCEARSTEPERSRAAFFGYLVESLCWQDRERRLLGPRDPDYLLQVEDRRDFATDDDRLAAALLLEEGILAPFPDNTLRPLAAPTRAQAIGVLARTALRAGAPGLIQAEFSGLDAGDLKVRRNGEPESFEIDPQVRLFRSIEGAHPAASEVTLAVGDKVRLVRNDGRVVFLDVEQSRLGAAADRGSRYFRWDVPMTPDEVAQGIARYGRVGRVQDVVVRRVGVSGRVVDLAVLGSDGELLLHGLKIRWALNLRENLFVIDRETDAKGRVERFIFSGKGWGHGVGLCQVGAYGMAQSGLAYGDILRHYYTGISLQQAY